MADTIATALERMGLLWRESVDLKELCSWHIGGPADYLVEPATEEQLRRLWLLAREREIPIVVLGRGSNMLFDDAGFRGLVVRLGRRFGSYRFEGEYLEAQAGAWVPWLARSSAVQGLSGLEHVVGIPGTLGGLVYMNGGSMRKSLGDSVVQVRALTASGDFRDFDASQCGFDYRRSAFQDNGALILGARLKLTASESKAVRREMLAIMAQRREKFPLAWPSCGSVFRNDPELYAAYGPPGKIIDQGGYKGLRVGGAQVSHRHGNFIVNLGGATSADVFVLVRELRQRVQDLTGFTLGCEVRYLSPQGDLGPLDRFL